MKTKLNKEKDYSKYLNKHERMSFQEVIESFKYRLNLNNIFLEKTDEELLKWYDNSSLGSGLQYAVVDLCWFKSVVPQKVHEDWSITNLMTFGDEYIENLQKCSNNNN